MNDANPKPPQWLKELVGRNKAALREQASEAVKSTLAEKHLHTVCVEALCPNKGKCFCEGDATFLILGDACTRGCKFCAVSHKKPEPPDEDEPRRIADAVKKWKLRFAVLTSPTRDDLPDGGAAHFAKVIKTIRAACPHTGTEPLVPDFSGSETALATVLAAEPQVLAHNMETVPRLYAEIRIGADYARSLALLKSVKRLAPGTAVKSGLMLGLGETEEEILSTLSDMLANEVEILTLGQYLAPSKNHAPVRRYLEPGEYDALGEKARRMGFKAVLSGPLVRSSYLAGRLHSQYLQSLK